MYGGCLRFEDSFFFYIVVFFVILNVLIFFEKDLLVFYVSHKETLCLRYGKRKVLLRKT